MFNSAFLQELDALLARHNVARTMQRGKIMLIDTNGVEDEGRRSLRLYGAHYGLSEQDFGAVFTFRGTRYKLVGLKTNRPKYPLDCEHLGDGRVFKFHTSVVPDIVAQRGRAPTTPAHTLPPSNGNPLGNRFANHAQF